MRVAGQTDADVAALYREAEEPRATEFARVTEALHAHGILRADVSATRAADILMTIFSPQTYLAFTEARGWTDQEFAAWMTSALTQLLVAER